MIDLRHELQYFLPINLNSLMQSGLEISDDMKNSVILYNKALESVKGSSEDIAIIELKKAIALNPNFHEAMNLLGICYSYINETPKAAEMFEKVIAAENNCVKAMNYMNRLGLGNPAGVVSENKNKPKSSIKNSIDRGSKAISGIGNAVKNSSGYRNLIMRYAVGFVFGAAIMFILSSQLNSAANGDANQAGDNGDSSKDISTIKANYEAKYKTLNTKNKQLEQGLKEANQNADYYKNAFKLLEAENLYNSRNYISAADELTLLKSVKFKGSEKSLFDSLKQKVMPLASKSLMYEGNSLMYRKDYGNAVKKYNKALLYDSSSVYTAGILYNLGKCYNYQKDTGNAQNAFKKLIDKYPASSYAKYAKYYIDD